MDFGRIFVIAVVVAVTAAQLAGNNKRNKNNKDTQDEQHKQYNQDKDSDIKVHAENLPPSFEADNREGEHIQGFDVK